MSYNKRRRPRWSVPLLAILTAISAILATAAGVATNLVSELFSTSWVVAHKGTVLSAFIVIAISGTIVTVMLLSFTNTHMRSRLEPDALQQPLKPENYRFWSVPYSPSRAFMGRNRELDWLRRVRSGGNSILVVVGMGGVGKTELVVQHIYSEITSYRTGVWWVTDNHVEENLERLAIQLGLEKHGKQEDRVRAVTKWLEERSDWCLVLDDVASHAAIREYLPRSPNGTVLITSRNQHWPSDVEMLSLDVLTGRAAAQIVTYFVGEDQSAPAQELAEELGGTPVGTRTGWGSHEEPTYERRQVP
jgi:hypothetical protein